MSPDLVLVVGAGLAGSLTTLAFASRGWRVLLVEKRRPPLTEGLPQHEHIHVFRADDLAWLALHFGISLPGSGGDRMPLPRASVEAAILARVADSPLIDFRSATRPGEIVRDKGTWRVELSDGDRQTCACVVDASGRALAALSLCAKSGGRDITVEEIRDRFRYRTWQMAPGAAADTGSLSLVLTTGAHLHAAPGPDGKTALTWIGAGKPPDRLSDIRKTLPKDASEGIVEVAGPASSAPFVTFSGGALAATEVEGMQNGPLLVGDALIQTPPRFGDGLRHIRGQVGILESHLEKDSFDPPACAGDLADYAAAVWDGLILTLGLEQQGLHGDRE